MDDFRPMLSLLGCRFASKFENGAGFNRPSKSGILTYQMHGYMLYNLPWA
jgi:hypothetical protein